MPFMVTTTAQCQCSFGAAPAALIAFSAPTILIEGKPAAVIMDNKLTNIPTFATCSSMANPTVASATAAAAGVLTPMPCVPVIAAPWVPGQPKVLINGTPALTVTSKCMCNWGGVITITNPGTTKVQC